MTREEAKEFLLFIANKLGYIGVEDLTDRDGKRMIEAIKALEEPQWIPCSERLPGHDQICIVTDDTRIGTYEYGFHKETYDEKNGWTYLRHKIIAWMPLPEAWRGDAE